MKCVSQAGGGGCRNFEVVLATPNVPTLRPTFHPPSYLTPTRGRTQRVLVGNWQEEIVLGDSLAAAPDALPKSPSTKRNVDDKGGAPPPFSLASCLRTRPHSNPNAHPGPNPHSHHNPNCAPSPSPNPNPKSNLTPRNPNPGER